MALPDRMKMPRPLICGSFFMLFLVFACSNNKEWQEGGGSVYFEDVEGELEPRMRIYHPASDSSLLFVQVDHKDLLYTRPRKDKEFRARVRVISRFRKKGETHSVDSTTLVDQGRDESGSSWGALHLKVPNEQERGLLKVEVRDLNRNRSYKKQLLFDRKGPNTRQNFLPVKEGDSLPWFKDHFPDEASVRLLYERRAPQAFQGRYYGRDFDLPPPPFVNEKPRSYDHKADSLFSLPIGEDERSFQVQVPDSGFVHVQVDSTFDRKGYTVYQFPKGFPEVKTVEAMLGPLRYLTSKKEFHRLKAEEDLKSAIDSFWVDRGGSKERARKLIESYYGRVEAANRHFTSHVEGWRTDRGLVHVIFGKPERVQRTSDGEKWVYGEQSDIRRLDFEFERVKNPFTENDMSLSRSQIYKSAWYRAVESWRNGRVYSN